MHMTAEQEMKTAVDVSMKTNIEQDGKKEQMHIQAPGELHKKRGYRYVMFTEQLDGIGEVNTVLKVGEHELTVIRKGAVSMRQQFQQGETTEGSYETPYGLMKTEARTHHVTSDWSGPQVHSIQFQYQMRVQGTEAGTYDVKISIEEDPGDNE
ncbi:DUF1934 domain-containing protein [Salsuginibacillus halophilus]|nr:DUF1934 family protein [Salsuginibacillus halophilus]